VDAPGPRLESILGHCKRHALLHMAPKWFDHWTTWAGLPYGYNKPMKSTYLFIKHSGWVTIMSFSRTAHKWTGHAPTTPQSKLRKFLPNSAIVLAQFCNSKI